MEMSNISTILQYNVSPMVSPSVDDGGAAAILRDHEIEIHS